MFKHLYEIVRSRARLYPEAIALGGREGLDWRTLDSRQFLDLVDRLALELSDREIKEGDRVVLWVPSHWRTPVYLFALWKLGAIAVPFDREMNPEAATKIAESVDPQAIIVGYGERPVWAQSHAVTEWWEPGSVRNAPPESHDWAPPGEELAAIYFTSGTTGTPKGCMITHANLCSQVNVLSDVLPLDPSCRLASILPLSHLYELTCGLLYPLSQGAAIHYIPSRRAADVVRVLAEQQITHMIAVPQLLTMMGHALDDELRKRLPATAYRALMRLSDRVPFAARRQLFWMVHRKLGGHLRLIASGGAALPAEIHRLWERMGVRIAQGYGTSECSPVIASAAADGSTPIGSVGKAIRGVEVRLSPDGELLVRGPNVMRGYWKDPERTAGTFKDGWFATGDIATIDKDGYIWLQGRAKDLIALPSGLKVWPEDVEAVLCAHPGIKDAAVVAVPLPGGGAKLHAYLLPAPGWKDMADLTAIVAQSNGRLALHQRVSTASWWEDDDFPRTTTLKVRRNLLPQPEKSTSVTVQSVLAADDPVALAVCGVARVSSVRPEQTLGELGFDSLSLVELTLVLEEKSGKSIGDGDLRPDMTVADVRAFLSSAPDLGASADQREGGPQGYSGEPPLWPYRWGRLFRFIGAPLDLVYRVVVPRTIILGAENLENLTSRVIFAGTHHGFGDTPLLRYALAHSGNRRIRRSRLIIAISAGGFNSGGPLVGGIGILPWYGMLAFGVYPLRQYTRLEESLRRLARTAGGGNSVLIFPQGTHAKPEEERVDSPRVRFHTGVAYLAEALNAPVVPFGVAGTERVIPSFPEEFKGLKIAGIPVSLKRSPMAIAFGAPVKMESAETPQAFTARLQQVCYGLSRQAEEALAVAE